MIGILYHPMIPRALPMAEDVAAWLGSRDEVTWVETVNSAEKHSDKIADSELVVALGGDGTVLRAGRVCGRQDVPVFSINLGKLGFLTEASPADWQQRLGEVLAERCRIEKRLMLEGTVERDGNIIDTVTAMNEIVIGRGSQVRVVRFQLFVDGNLVAAYVADALIAATPTGSTAYAMAAGGPIMPPELPNYMVLPVAPHLSLDRAIVLHENAEAVIRPHFDHEAQLTADGQRAVALKNGDIVRIKRSIHDTLLVRVEDPSYFYRRLNARSGGLRGDLRNL